MQFYDINIPVNGAREINVQGDYVYYLGGSAGGSDNAITLRNISGSDTMILRPGQAVRLGGGDENVRWVVGNFANQGTIIGTLLMGKGEFSDNRISGSVEVIDGGKNRTMGGVAMMAAQVELSGQAALSNTHQVINPAGSGKNIIIEQFSVSASAQALIYMGWNNTVMGTPGGAGFSKRSGGAGSVATRCVSNISGLPTNGVVLGAYMVAPNVGNLVSLREPIFITPGYIFFIQSQTVNLGISTTVEYFEENI